MSQDLYQAEALVRVHHERFGYITQNAAQHLLRLLDEQNIHQGSVIDLGCGSGILAEIVAQHEYDVIGVDYSAEFINMAEKNVPNAQFVVQSIYDYEFPPCVGVACIGEVLNYYFEDAPGLKNLELLFPKIYQALEHGGVLLFDIQEEGKRLGPENPKNRIREDENWFVLTEREENLKKATFTKKFTAFHKIGELYQKSNEIHRLQFFNINEVVQLLENIGFEVFLTDGYNGSKFYSKHFVFAAVKV